MEVSQPAELETLEDTQGEIELDPRRCQLVKDDGTQCQGWRVGGEDLCAGHLKLGIASDPEGYGRRGAAESARVARDRAEERRRGPQDAYRAALVGNAEDLAAELVRIALHGESDADRLRAIESLSSRVLGKPTENVQHTVRVPQTVAELEAMTDAELDALIGDAELAGEIQLLALPPALD